MGLAASQARFLAITARKADCEFRSMQIAQNKLSVTREMELATQDYQQAMNATKMVWDYDGDQSFLTDVSYSMLMTPSYLNNFNPYLITNRGGQVIVDSKIAAAAKAAGIDAQKGGTRNPVNMYKFLEAMGVQNIIAGKTKSDIEIQLGLDDGKDGNIFMHAEDRRLARYNDDGTMNNMSGLLSESEKNAFYAYVASNGITIDGKKYGGTTGATAESVKAQIKNLKVDGVNRFMKGMTVEEILNQYSCYNKNGKLVTINGLNYVINGSSVKTGGVYSKIMAKNAQGKYEYVMCNYNENAGYGSIPMSKNEYTDTGIVGIAKKLRAKKEDGTSLDVKSDTYLASAVSGYASGLNFFVNNVSQASVSLSDILTGDVCMVATYADGKHVYSDSTYNADGISDVVDKFFEQGALAILRALNPDKTINNIEDCGDESFISAYNFTKKRYGIVNDNGYEAPYSAGTFSKKGVGEVQTAAEKAANKVNKIAWAQNDGGSYNSVAAVNLSHLFGYFLTAYDNFVTGWESNYTVDTNYEDCVFVTQDPEFRFAILSETTQTNETVMESDFYMQLYNNLCINGYVLDTNIKENKYLEQMLENGAYYLCGVNQQDGYFYQARYNDDVRTLIKVVNDEDAKARAESEYNYQKMRLTAKEDRLDLEMKNIDMEIASLTTEYDSVKNLISKSVEKTFKQFDG